MTAFGEYLSQPCIGIENLSSAFLLVDVSSIPKAISGLERSDIFCS
jgi:hypothetical protein